MSADYHRAKRLFLDAMDQPEEQRQQWLADACGGDVALLAEVHALLACRDEIPTQATAHRPSLESPPEIPGYRILSILAQGGMGRVWLAEREGGEFRQKVAIKLMSAEALRDPEAQARFRAERQILASLDHPHIARLLDGGSIGDGWPYLVMEFVEGDRIDRWCAQQQLDARGCVDLLLRVAQALQAAHRQLVVHRDLKPGNVLVDHHGEPKLLDFGIAKLLEGGALELTHTDTRTGAQLLTPRYAAPEQVRGESVSTATDVYAFGVLMYELLTGQSPYGEQVSSMHRLPMAVCEWEPDAPSQRLATPSRTMPTADGNRGVIVTGPASHIEARQLRGDLDAIVLKCLRKQAADRYPGMDALIADLQAWRSGEPVEARRGNRFYRIRRRLRRHWFGLSVAAGVLLLTLGFVFQMARQLEQTRIERDRAATERDKAGQVTGFLVDVFKNADPSKALGETVTVRQALDRGVEALGERLQEHPAVRSHLLRQLSSIYLELGNHAQALELATQAKAALEGADDADADERLATDYALAMATEANDGSGESAEPLYRNLLQGARAVGDDRMEQTALNRLATLALDAGHFDQALPLFNELRTVLLARLHVDSPTDALDLALPVASTNDEHGSDLEWLAVNAHNQCRVLLQLDRLDEADAECQLAKALKQRLYPALHPAHIATDVVLAHLAERRGDLAGTIAAERNILANTARTYGEDHFRTAYMMVNLASSLTKAGEFDDAEPLFVQALTILEKNLGREHPAFLMAQSSYANLLGRRGDWAQSLTLHAEVLALRRTVLGEDHADVASSLLDMANAQNGMGRYPDAVASATEAVALLERTLGESHPTAIEAMVSLSKYQLTAGMPEAADRTAQRALALIAKDELPPNIRGSAQFVRARALRLLGRSAEARSLAELALQDAQVHPSEQLSPQEIQQWLLAPE